MFKLPGDSLRPETQLFCSLQPDSDQLQGQTHFGCPVSICGIELIPKGATWGVTG